MLKIFMSYSRADEAIAKEIYNHLELAGMSVFHDSMALDLGINWQDEINKAILEADIGLLLLSPASIQSLYVRNEVQKLSAQNKRIYTVLISDLGDMELPKYLDSIQYIDLTTSSKNLDVLIEAMKNLEDLPSKTKFSVIIPFKEEGSFIASVKENNLFLMCLSSDFLFKLNSVINCFSDSGFSS